MREGHRGWGATQWPDPTLFKSRKPVRDARGMRPGREQQHRLTVVQSLSLVRLFATPWMLARQAPLSTGLSGKEPREGGHFLLQGILPTPGIKPASLASLARGLLTPEPPWEGLSVCTPS